MQSATMTVLSSEEMSFAIRLSRSEQISWNQLTLLQDINQGSFGRVFLATLDGREVSVKLAKTCDEHGPISMTKEQVKNFEREINTYRTLDHPAIVHYIGCVLDYPNLAIVTEYLPNGNVFDLLYMRKINISAALRLRMARTVAMAVSYMHTCDPVVIHKDLKTQNLVLDEHYNVKLCDFGKTEALSMESFDEQEEAGGGSPRYMAPECFLGNWPITEKVDIWSLGCCLVEILGGPLPYEHLPCMWEVKDAMLRQHQTPMVPYWFTPCVQPMLRKCFEFIPDQRIEINGVQLVLRGVTVEDMERRGMDRRRTC